MGLTSYLVDAQIPLHLLEWVKANISSKFVFLRDSLIILEILSLVLGCNIAILSIKFLNSLTLPGQLYVYKLSF